MADKGVIFSAAMVRALLDGRKTQTRRLLNPQPKLLRGAGPFYRPYPATQPLFWHALFGGKITNIHKVPYAPGGRLYVREAHSFGYDYDEDDKPLNYEAGPRVFYAASECPRWYDTDSDTWLDSPKWNSPIHMPRRASRLWLAVTDVRVQRVREISEADAIAEGIQSFHPANSVATFFHHTVPEHRNYGFINARRAFEDLWNSLHTKPGETWDDNPWVCAVSFAVHSGNIDGCPVIGGGRQ